MYDVVRVGGRFIPAYPWFLCLEPPECVVRKLGWRHAQAIDDLVPSVLDIVEGRGQLFSCRDPLEIGHITKLIQIGEDRHYRWIINVRIGAEEQVEIEDVARRGPQAAHGR